MRDAATAPVLPGTLVISLDFELHWGYRDYLQVGDHRQQLLRTREEIPQLLHYFSTRDIHATWAVVGFLFASTREELLASWPAHRPCYDKARLSPYRDISEIGCGEADDPCHFAFSLIQRIALYPTQEIASHTLSHYYCEESGQDRETFRQDLQAALAPAARKNIKITTLVFPRNQCNPSYLDICREAGITAYRGNPTGWLYSGGKGPMGTVAARAGRLLDAYLNLTGHHCCSVLEMQERELVNIHASRLLRAYPRVIRGFESFRLRRILSGMTAAARQGLVYHLWLHPESLGWQPEHQWNMLHAIVDHFAHLQAAYGMRSRNMRELAIELCDTTGNSSIQPGYTAESR